MTMYPPRDTPRVALEQATEALVRRLTVESGRLGHAFAQRHSLHETDLQALVQVMDAEGRGAPLTPGQLAERLELSSGATSAVIDRLESAGHVRRDRDPDDRRRVRLHYGEAGARVALEFFGGMRTSSDAVMAGFTDEELATVARFLTAMSDAITEHRARVAEPGS